MSNGGKDDDPPTIQSANCPPTYIFGVASLILVVVFWDILDTYPKPFFMGYLTNLSYLLYFVFWLVDDPVMRLVRKQSERDAAARKLEDGNIQLRELPPFTRTQLAKIAFVFFALYLASNYATNVAFGATSVSSASILAATCGFFTLTFGWMMGVEVLSIMRVIAVLISVGGVLILGIPELLHDSSKSKGNTFALVGAIFYGIYSIFLKRVAIDESRISMPIVFAFGGLYTLLFAWPILVGLDYFGVESFEVPSSKVALYLGVNVFLGGFIPNYLWNVAFVCTSPLVVAIGISFAIPLTLIIAYLRGEHVDFFRITSGLMVVIGFVIVNLANIYPEWDLRAERLLVKFGLMREEDVRSTEERAAKQRNELLAASHA